jgi:hypothetical protein
MRFASVARFIITAIAALALAACVSDPNNLNRRVGLNSTSQQYSSGLMGGSIWPLADVEPALHGLPPGGDQSYLYDAEVRSGRPVERILTL